MSRDLVRACAIGRAATLRRGPGPPGVRADGPLFAGRLGHADVGAGDVRRACAYVPRQCVRGPTSGYVNEQACVCPRPTEVRLDRRAGRRRQHPDAARPRTADRTVLAVDGKSLRGARTEDGEQRHLCEWTCVVRWESVASGVLRGALAVAARGRRRSTWCREAEAVGEGGVSASGAGGAYGLPQRPG